MRMWSCSLSEGSMSRAQFRSPEPANIVSPSKRACWNSNNQMSSRASHLAGSRRTSWRSQSLAMTSTREAVSSGEGVVMMEGGGGGRQYPVSSMVAYSWGVNTLQECCWAPRLRGSSNLNCTGSGSAEFMSQHGVSSFMLWPDKVPVYWSCLLECTGWVYECDECPARLLEDGENWGDWKG